MEHFQVRASTQSSSHFTFLHLSGQHLQNQVKLEKEKKKTPKKKTCISKYCNANERFINLRVARKAKVVL